MPFTIEARKAQETATKQLRAMRKLPARYTPSDLDGAIKSAARASEKAQRPYFVYPGNGYGRFLWRVTYKLSEALCTINNTGGYAYELQPDREVTRLIFAV